MAKKKNRARATVGRIRGRIRLATIDIGSNAARLFVAEVTRPGRTRTLVDERASVRLGTDVFTTGRVGAKSVTRLTEALTDFHATCERLDVTHVVAVGTSALRDATNSADVLKRLAKDANVAVKLIDGRREAALLHVAVDHAVNLKKTKALLIDLGGGSLELVFSDQGRITRKLSLPVGAVRLLAQIGRRPTRAKIAAIVHPHLDRTRPKFPKGRPKLMIGTGGNLRALGKLCFRLGLSRSKDRFRETHLAALVDRLFTLTLSQRITRFQLRPDRADVILPAAVTILELMRAFDLEEIQVPDVGLKNGLFWHALERLSLLRK